MAYTHKMVNGVKIALSAADQTALANKDAADWEGGQAPAAMVRSAPSDKLARMAQAFGLTVDELKTELAKA